MAGQSQKYIGTLLSFGERATINAGLTRYLAAPGGTNLASELAIIVPASGKVKNFRWSAAASGLTGTNNKITLFVNGVSTPLEATWNGGALSGGNTSTEVTVIAGDRVSVRIALAAGGTSITRPRVSLELELDSTSRWLTDDPIDPDANIYYLGGGNVGIGTDTPGEKLSVDGIIESGTGGFKFPDGTLQTTAFGALGGINALTGAGGMVPDAVYVDSVGRIGVGIGSARDPQEKLTLAPDSNFVTEMPTPNGVTAAPQAGGGLPADDYFFRVSASDGTGFTKASDQLFFNLTAGNGIRISWNPVLGATKYRLYRSLTAFGAYKFIETTNTYHDYLSDAVFMASGTPPEVTTAFVNKLSASGPSWLLGGNVGIGTNNPQAALEVKGEISGFGIVPIGSIIAWHKSQAGTPTLPDGWAACDGQLLNDAASPYFGQLMPNLNDTNRFLQGNATSGSIGGSSTHSHAVGLEQVTYDMTPDASHFADGTRIWVESSSHIPPFFNVVWIMRVK